MKRWTYHPIDFRLDDPNEALDPSRGKYWNYFEPNFRAWYRHVLLELQERLGTNQLLWCFTTPANDFKKFNACDADRVEWRIEISLSSVLAFYSSPVWENILRGRSNQWESLFLSLSDEYEAENEEEVGALLDFRQLRSAEVICLGRVPTADELRERRRSQRQAQTKLL